MKFVRLNVGNLDAVVDVKLLQQPDELVGKSRRHHDVHGAVVVARLRPEIETITALRVELGKRFEGNCILGFHFEQLVPATKNLNEN